MSTNYFFEALVTLVDFFPVHHIPPGLQILGTAVVVLEIVGVLPDVVAENGMESLRYRAVLVRRGENLHFALGVASQPDPSAAKLARAGGVEFFLKSLEVAESLLDYVGDRAGGIASAIAAS